MDNSELEGRITTIAARSEQIRSNSAEFLWVCRGVKPALLPPDKPLPQAATSLGDPAVNPVQSQPQPQPRLRPLNSGGAVMTWAAVPERKNPAK